MLDQIGTKAILISEMVRLSHPIRGTNVTVAYSSPSVFVSSSNSVSPNLAALDIIILSIPLCGICAKPPAYSGSHGVVTSPSLSVSFTNTSNFTYFSPSNFIPFINKTSLAFAFSASVLFTAGLFTRVFSIASRVTGNFSWFTVFTSPGEVNATCDSLFRFAGRLLRQGNTDSDSS
ncbi:hypothetical protein HanXRQr2_Chr15g0716121 [Helianthus annuus]|uniref:Uncharacterized protein n=1 Tax=Helianthus annuus TaxID=4232 RepID=A0A9K3E5P9_HELAN|nr:hypothetical protein HanXRQr2_Chr15g0716121 [Helianthus annuus]KAJ0833170.1 hypothetical protein HanPSC8_Chr15g0687171 [Helianthus annuus]